MSYYHLLIEKGCSLKSENRQLIYTTEDKRLSIPIEDISVMIVESIDVSMTSELLFKLAHAGVCVIFLDDTHSPIGELLPLNNHSRPLKSLECQLSMSKPFKNRIWQRIIENKIYNQSTVLKLLNDSDNGLFTLSKRVSSGDKENLEARAAITYFKHAFDAPLMRRNEDIRNVILNYGYAIIRSKISQELSSYGFIECLGVNHRSDTNRFNLSYDLIEPFRVFVDLKMQEIVNDLMDINEISLDTSIKQQIIGVVEESCLIGSDVFTVHTAIKRYIKGFSEAVHGMDYTKLVRVEVLV